jgi:hypothetical protein
MLDRMLTYTELLISSKTRYYENRVNKLAKSSYTLIFTKQFNHPYLIPHAPLLHLPSSLPLSGMVCNLDMLCGQAFGAKKY